MELSRAALSEATLFALDVAREAGALTISILPESWADKGVQLKGPTDLVTRADHEAERLIVSRIRERFPGHAIVGEEGTRDAGTGPRWYVDPVDGTTNFAHGFPWYSVSIGFEQQGRLAAGVVFVPTLDEMFVAERGRGAFRVEPGGRLQALCPSTTSEIGDALVATGLPAALERPPHIRNIAAVMQRTRKFRMTGSAAIHLAYVAAGRLDVFWEPTLHSWDVAAGIVLVEEAGGRVSDPSGRPLRTLDGDILATNGPLHDAFVAIVSS
jgi:myo-inositol-1(or 4)-monophosphatase